MTKGSKFDDFLKDENIEIDEKKIKENIEQMTVKEIIIDGVDVAGCVYMLNNKIKGKQHCPAKAMPYAKETSCICRKSIDTPYNFCKHNPNCYYKQLKRLEQENAELKAYRDVNEDFKTAWEELKAENERLQKLTCFNCGEETLSPSGAEIYDKILVYKQTLQEIKDYLNTLSGIDNDFVNTETYLRILDLITKAEINE